MLLLLLLLLLLCPARPGLAGEGLLDGCLLCATAPVLMGSCCWTSHNEAESETRQHAAGLSSAALSCESGDACGRSLQAPSRLPVFASHSGPLSWLGWDVQHHGTTVT